MSIDFYDKLSDLSSLSCLIPLCLVYSIFRLRSSLLLPLGILILVSFITETISYVLLSKGSNNLEAFRIYTIIELILLSSFYMLHFKLKKLNIIVFFSVIIFLIVSIIDFNVNGTNNFDNYATTFEAFFFSILSFWSFYYMLKHLSFKDPLRQPFFWINTAVLLYFGGNLILFIFNNQLLHSNNSDHLILWSIHSCLNILYNCLIAVAFWKTRRP